MLLVNGPDINQCWSYPHLGKCILFCTRLNAKGSEGCDRASWDAVSNTVLYVHISMPRSKITAANSLCSQLAKQTKTSQLSALDFQAIHKLPLPTLMFLSTIADPHRMYSRDTNYLLFWGKTTQCSSSPLSLGKLFFLLPVLCLVLRCLSQMYSFYKAQVVQALLSPISLPSSLTMTSCPFFHCPSQVLTFMCSLWSSLCIRYMYVALSFPVTRWALKR